MVSIFQPKPKGELRQLAPRPEALRLIPESTAREFMAIPLAVEGNTLLVAMANPADIVALEALAAQAQKRIEAQMALPEKIQEAIDLNYKNFDEIEKQVSSIIPTDETKRQSKQDTDSDAPAARLLTLIIDEAVKARASDIHLEPQDDKLQVRYRIDGTLHTSLSLPQQTANLIISRIKILANMNIADHHQPQDGRFSIEAKGRLIDIRVGTAPVVFGEMAVLRLLNKSQAALTLSQLGFLPDSLTKYQKMVNMPYGMILVSGPTGAGKTTTLYASLNGLNQEEHNIITIEDPVEYQFKHINQIQVNVRAGITFAKGLRSILRLDPNVVLVGEIRDSETAGIAVQAALTGHLVLSSIHANDSVGAVFRLLDLGVEPFLISSALIGIISQRMARKICPDCAQEVKTSVVEQLAYNRILGEKRETFSQGKGCNACSNTGYRGRTGIFEILQMSERIREMLVSGTTNTKLREQALADGMVPLIKDGMLKVQAGITTPSEILRNAYSTE